MNGKTRINVVRELEIMIAIFFYEEKYGLPWKEHSWLWVDTAEGFIDRIMRYIDIYGDLEEACNQLGQHISLEMVKMNIAIGFVSDEASYRELWRRIEDFSYELYTAWSNEEDICNIGDPVDNKGFYTEKYFTSEDQEACYAKCEEIEAYVEERWGDEDAEN